jgi:hypothetical protein
MTAESTAVCDQQYQTAEAQVALSGSTAAAARLKGGRCPTRKLAGGYAQFAQTCPDSAGGIADACGPGSPDSHRVVWGLTSRPPVPPRAFLRFPVCPPGSPPSPAFLWFPFVRRSPVRPFGRCPGSGSPSVSLRVPLPLSNLHDSAAEGRFRRRWSRAERAKVTSPAATTPRLDLAVIRPALQMSNGWGRCDVATESPVTSGRERRTQKAAARQRAMAGQPGLSLSIEPTGGPLPITSSRMGTCWTPCGARLPGCSGSRTPQTATEVFHHLLLARIIESASKLGSLRVLGGAAS